MSDGLSLEILYGVRSGREFRYPALMACFNIGNTRKPKVLCGNFILLMKVNC